MVDIHDEDVTSISFAFNCIAIHVVSAAVSVALQD